MVDFRSILVERMEYKDSILYLYCKTFYKVVGNNYYRKYDYNVYHRKVLKFKNVKRFEYYLDEQIYNFVCELNDLQEELGIDYFSKIFYKSKKRNRLYIFERGYFGDFIMIEFKDDEKEKIVINEKEKYLEKTKIYYNYFKYDFCSKESEDTRNLVISKEGVRVEIIFDKKWR